MAKKAALGVIEIGSGPAALGELRRWRIGENGEEIDVTVMGSGNRSALAGIVANVLEADVFYEAADAGQLLIIVGQETPTQIVVFPQGKGSGLPQATGNFRFINKDTEGDVSGAIEMTFSASADENGITWDTQV